MFLTRSDFIGNAKATIAKTGMFSLLLFLAIGNEGCLANPPESIELSCYFEKQDKGAPPVVAFFFNPGTRSVFLDGRLLNPSSLFFLTDQTGEKVPKVLPPFPESYTKEFDIEIPPKMAYYVKAPFFSITPREFQKSWRLECSYDTTNQEYPSGASPLICNLHFAKDACDIEVFLKELPGVDGLIPFLNNSASSALPVKK